MLGQYCLPITPVLCADNASISRIWDVLMTRYWDHKMLSGRIFDWDFKEQSSFLHGNVANRRLVNEKLTAFLLIFVSVLLCLTDQSFLFHANYMEVFRSQLVPPIPFFLFSFTRISKAGLTGLEVRPFLRSREMSTRKTPEFILSYGSTRFAKNKRSHRESGVWKISR